MKAVNGTAGVGNATVPGRSAAVQGGYQVVAIIVTLAIAIVGGVITG